MKYGLVFFSLFFCANVFAQTEAKYDYVLDSLIRKGKQREATSYFLLQLNKYPKNETVLRCLAYAYLSDNKLDKGEKYYKEALLVNSKCGRCYMNLGKINIIQKEFTKAAEYFDKAISVDDKDGLLYLARAEFNVSQGDKFKPLFDYNKAIILDPNNTNFYIARGIYNSAQGYFSLAISDLNKAVELSPKNYYSYFQRSSVYYNKQMFNEALVDITTAIKLDSSRSELYNGRGAIYSRLKNYNSALADYTMAIHIDTTNYLSYYDRALERYAQEDMDGSCTDIYEALRTLNKYDSNNELKPTLLSQIEDHCDSLKPSYYYQRGIAYYNLKQFDKAELIYTKGLIKFPNNSLSYSFRGNVYFTLKNYQKALLDYSAAINNKEDIIATVRQNARFINTPEDSINLFVNTSLTSIHASIAEYKFALGLYDGALVEINKSMDIKPTLKEVNEEINYNIRGNILLALGKNTEAKNDFDKCVKINPNTDLAHVNRAIARVRLTNEIKITNISINGGVDNKMFNANWLFPSKNIIKKPDVNLNLALLDCDKAIEINDKLGYAYYVRSQIKKMLNYTDYCYDLLKAKQLDYTITDELLQECK
jgi:tetratricopeptide (TPR) repeat protein